MLPGGLVEGFDLDGEQISLARRRARQSGASGLRFTEGDALDLAERPDGSFDRAICQALLVHQARPGQALAEMARLVAPGGLVAAVEPDFTRDAQGPDDDLVPPDTAARRAAMRLTLAEAAAQLGLGCWNAGARLPELFAQADIEVLRSWPVPTLRLTSADPAGRAWAAELEAATHPEAVEAELRPWGDLFLQAGGEPARWQQHVQDEEILASQRRRRLASGQPLPPWSPPLTVCVGRAAPPATIAPRRTGAERGP